MASIYFRQDTQKWQLNIRIAGHKPISRQCKTEREAIALAGELEARIRNGETVGALDKARKVTFRELAEAYVQSSAFLDKTEHTQRSEKSKLFGSSGPLCESSLCDHFGKLTLNQITSELLNDYKDKRRNTVSKKYNRPYSADAVRLELNLIKQIFKFAKNAKGINIPSPFADGAVSQPKCKGSGEVITDFQLFEIRDILERKRDDKKALHFFLVALDTAMRAGEIQRISKADIDFEKQTIFLPKTKNGSSRTVIFNSAEVADALKYRVEQCPADCPYIFFQFDKEGNYRQYDYQESWKLLNRKISKSVRFHWLRHTAITKIYETTDWSDLKIASITGHKSLQSLKIYAHIRTQNIDKAVLEVNADKSNINYMQFSIIKEAVLKKHGVKTLTPELQEVVQQQYAEMQNRHKQFSKNRQQQNAVIAKVEKQDELAKQAEMYDNVKLLTEQMTKMQEQLAEKDKIIQKLIDKI